MEIHFLVYRATAATEARKAGVRQGILAATRELVAAGGFGMVQVSDVARRAGVATGTIYRYFPSKPFLFAEVFRRASQREVDELQTIADSKLAASARLRDTIGVFTTRAARARRLAYALIAEPVDPLIESERLRFRSAYDRIFRQILRDGVEAGEFVAIDIPVAAACVVGALAESLVGPLAPDAHLSDRELEELIGNVTAFCLRATTGRKDP